MSASLRDLGSWLFNARHHSLTPLPLHLTIMAKKPRSQRRKKGSKLGEQEDGATAAVDVDVELLSESHTVADSMSTFDDFGERTLRGFLQ